MFHTRPFCISFFQRGSCCGVAGHHRDAARVPSTMSFTSLKSGQPASTRAPSERKTRARLPRRARPRASTGMRPPRSGVHAMRQPLTDGAVTAARELARVDGVGERRAVVGPGHHGEHQRGVGDRARHRPGHADRVPAERSRMMRARGPGVVRKPTTPQNAAGMRSEPPSVRALGERAHARGERHRGAAARPAAGERGVPGIARRPEHGVERVAARAELRRVGLADDDRARLLEALDDDRVLLRHVIREDLRAPRGADALRRRQVLDRHGHAVKRRQRGASRLSAAVALRAPASAASRASVT